MVVRVLVSECWMWLQAFCGLLVMKGAFSGCVCLTCAFRIGYRITIRLGKLIRLGIVILVSFYERCRDCPDPCAYVSQRTGVDGYGDPSNGRASGLSVTSLLQLLFTVTVKVVTWLILPVVICLSQRLSHACLSICFYTVKLQTAH